MTFWQDARPLPARSRRTRRRRRGRVVAVAAFAATAVGLTTAVPEVRTRLGGVAGGERAARPAAAPRATDRGAAEDVRLRPRWRATMASQPRAVVADELGVLATGVNEVVAVDLRSGRRLWNAPLRGGVGYLAADEESVVVATEEAFVVLERRSGERRFEVPTPDEPGPVGILRPRAGPAMLVVTTQQGGVAGLDPATGAAAWSLRPGGELRGIPAIDDTTATLAAVFEGVDTTRLVVVDLRLGRVRWEERVAPWASSPLIDGDRVVLGAGDGRRHATMQAFDLADGTPRWRVRTDASFQADIVPTATGGKVYALDQLGTLVALDARRGTRLWRVRLGDAVLGGRPVVVGATVLVTGFSDLLTALSRTDGRVLARWRTSGLPVGLVAVGETVVLAQRLVAGDHLGAFRVVTPPVAPTGF